MKPQDKQYDQLAAEIFYSGLRAVDPYKCVMLQAEHILSVFRRGKYRKLLLVAFGKAAVPMTKALAEIAGDVISQGVLITKYGHVAPDDVFRNISVFEAGHPIPDVNGFTATKEVIRLMDAADESAFIVFLVSGGGSALLIAPHDNITLTEKQEVTDLLLKAGADIVELNTVRKHLSRVKGGRLAGLAHPARIMSLILSDVIGDPLDVIASGPTSPDETTYSGALKVFEKYGLTGRVPQNIMDLFKKGDAGLLAETPKSGTQVFQGVENIIIGSNRMATEAAARKAKELGFAVTILSNEIQGEAKEVGAALARQALKIKETKGPTGRICLIQGGETTVTVRGSGRGGRNTELALAFAMEIEGADGISMLSAGTDGTDGPTDAAGAIVNGETVKKLRAQCLDPASCIMDNDSYTFLQKVGGLFITGPTGTNVMDLQIVLIT